MQRYVLSDLADADLQGIYEWTYDHWGEAQLHSYRAAINTALDAIANEPFLSKSTLRDDLALGCRVVRVEHHYIVYRIGAGQIEVGRVLHKRMDFQRHIADDVFD